MAAAPAREPSTPPLPPVIGKAGRYTIFITPPATPRLPREKPLSQSPLTPSPRSSSVNASFLPQKSASPAAPPVQNLSVDVVAAHSSLDEYLAEWLGLNQSRYQWAVDDYFENTGLAAEKLKSENQESPQKIEGRNNQYNAQFTKFHRTAPALSALLPLGADSA
ncbi:hypothetical protein KSP40_PGU000504 [Platanthera guangdongensis]|uniref:Uncharacterized protein n=1 Tax=Platanthera guangdongensis TaxID=2320717 RepID=A0ABR2MTP7_9ASPA